MKMKYGVPEMDVVTFDAEDVIAVSQTDPTEPSTGLTNGGTGTGDSADFKDMFPGLG